MVSILIFVIAFFCNQPLITQEKLLTADAIVVIGGDHKPERVKRAVELFQQNYAPIVIISAGTLVLEGNETIPEAEVMKQQALNLGLPLEAIIIENESKSTFENAYYTKRILEQQKIKSILLVTSLYHSRRAQRIFTDVLPSNITVSIQPASQNHSTLTWLFYPDDVYVVFYEYYNWARYLLRL